MKLIPILKELSRRKRWLALGPVFAALIVVGVAKKIPSQVQWTATKEVLVDSTDSSVPDASKDMYELVYRAGIYAEIMTDPGVLDLIGKAAGVPGDEISATGPGNSVGQSAVHPATVASPGGYFLQLTLPNQTRQPIISIAAGGTTSQKAVALANGAAVGLSEYVNQLATSYHVGTSRRITVRDLGAPDVSSATSGIPKALLPAIFLIGIGGWCVLIIFAVRFRESWRTSDGSIGSPFPPDLEAGLRIPSAPQSETNPTPVAADMPARNGATQRSSRADSDELVDTFPSSNDDDERTEAREIETGSSASHLP